MDMPIGVLGGVTVTLPLISGWDETLEVIDSLFPELNSK